MTPLSTGGRVSAGVRAALAGSRASQYDVAVAEAEVALQVKEAYRRALFTRDGLTVFDDRVRCLDEDTAAFISPDETVEVLGSGAVTIVDPSGVECSSIADAKPGEPLTLIGVAVHVLAPGATFNLRTRQPHGSTQFMLGD